MMKLYNLENSDNQRNNIKLLMYNLKKWTLSLPRITRELTLENNIISEIAIINFKNELLKTDLNNNEFLFKIVKEIFNESDYKKLYSKIEHAKKMLDSYFENYETYIINQLKKVFDNNEKNSLNKILKNWYKSVEDKIKHIILKTETKQLLDYVDEIDTFNDNEIIENISYIMLGYYIEDWQDNSYSLFFNGFEYIIDELKNAKISNKNKLEISLKTENGNSIVKYIEDKDISSIGNTLMSNIEDTIDEYADSIDENEKIKILMTILNKYM